MWTQAETGKKIEGKAIDKRIEGEAIQILTREEKRIWLPTKTLSKLDQKYISQWVPDKERLSVRVVKAGKDYKVIEITANSGGQNMRFVTWGAGQPHERKLKAGQVVTYRLKVKPKYVCKAYAGKTLLDKEDWNTKSKFGSDGGLGRHKGLGGSKGL